MPRIPRWRGAAPRIFVKSFIRALSMRNDNEILHGAQTRKLLQSRLRTLPCLTRMLTRDLFVVANLYFVFVTSAKEVLFLLALVCLLAGLDKVAHNPGIVYTTFVI